MCIGVYEILVDLRKYLLQRNLVGAMQKESS